MFAVRVRVEVEIEGALADGAGEENDLFIEEFGGQFVLTVLGGDLNVLVSLNIFFDDRQAVGFKLAPLFQAGPLFWRTRRRSRPARA